MKTLLLTALFNALRLYAGAGLFDRVAACVQSLTASDLPGADKMSLVFDFLGSEAQAIGTTLVRAIVEVVLLKTKAA
jgi:hypothetical protein